MKGIMALFGRSPFKPIQAHMEKSRSCVERIKPVINSIIDNEPAEFDRVFKEISDLESEADVIKNDIRSHLPKSIFLPIDRRDLLEILDIQEELPDTVQDIAILLTLRPLKLPANMKEPLNNLIDEVATVCNQAADLVQEFDELVEPSFGGKEAEKVLAMIEQINADETVADELREEEEDQFVAGDEPILGIWCSFQLDGRKSWKAIQPPSLIIFRALIASLLTCSYS